MNLLVLETSTSFGTVALQCGEHRVQLEIAVQQQQVATILALIEDLLKRYQLQLQDLDYLAFSAGPGSFTGIRIALGVIQGIALAINKPVLTISSLQVLAQTSWRVLQQPYIIPCINAYMDQVYWGCYQLNENGVMQAEQVDQVSAPEDILTPLNQMYCGVGNGWQVYADRIPSELINSIIHTDGTLNPQASDLLVLAQMAAQNGHAKPIDDISPYYLRGKGAWRKIATN